MESPPTSEPTSRLALLQRHRWLAFLLPLGVFMLLGTLEPTPPVAGAPPAGWSVPYAYYPALYALKIALTAAAVVFVLPGYREFPLRLSPLSLVVGMVGAVVWVGLCRLDLEHTHLQPLLERAGLGWIVGSGARTAFNPFEQLADRPAWAWTFLAVRFFGLVAVVPVIEEFFLRGFVMRLAVEPDWWRVPFGRVNALAVALGTLVPMLMHPGELLAAAAWFTMVTWLMVRTRNIWDCIAAHAATNLLLGVYVVASGDWRLL